MNAVSRKNLTEAHAIDAYEVNTASDAGGTLDDGRDRVRSCRTTVICIWGVSDPLHLDHGAKKGAWQTGSLTPRMSPSVLLTAALTVLRAANSAARLTPPKL
jgi:hypothetical protein